MPTLKHPPVQKPEKSATRRDQHVQVEKGTSSAVTKEAVKVYAEQHRAAMIRLANR